MKNCLNAMELAACFWVDADLKGQWKEGRF